MLARFQRERPQKRRINEPPGATEGIIFSGENKGLPNGDSKNGRNETMIDAQFSAAETKGRMFVSKRSSARGPAPAPGKSKPTSFDDASLLETIRLAKQDDSVAFETIYQRYGGRVYALCVRMLRDPVEAEDAFQDAFMLLFRIRTFRGESAFSSWLHRLTVNIVLMRLRRKRPTSVPLDESVEEDDEDRHPPIRTRRARLAANWLGGPHHPPSSRRPTAGRL